MADAYLWTKTLHIVFVIAWMASLFYLPRILVNIAEAGDHPAVRELRQHALWSEGMVWCSPEGHGQVSGLMKLQIDHLPLSMGGVRPTQGRTLAVMQVSGGSQSFNCLLYTSPSPRDS